MRFPPAGLVLLAALVLASPLVLAAQQPTPTSQDSLLRRLDRMQRQIDSLRRAVERTTDRLISLDERSAGEAARPAAADSLRRLQSSLGIYG